MTLDELNDFCGLLPATSHVVQWSDAHVWKVGPKVFAIGGWAPNSFTGIIFKTTPDEYDFLVRLPGVRPAPYLATRSPTWVQHFEAPGLEDDDLCDYLNESHRIVALGLTKKKRAELGLTFED